MKLKSFAMLASSGLLAGSIAYIAPAMADFTNTVDNNNITQPYNPNNSTSGENFLDPDANIGRLADNSPTNNQYNSNQNTNDTNAYSNNANNNAYSNTYNNNPGYSNNNPDAANPADQGSPDTATGDDDY